MITVFTDGACNHNKIGTPNIGSFAYVVLNESGNKIKESVTKELNTTNNRMELKAVIAALKDLKQYKSDILICSDSQYVVNPINQNWIANWKKNNFQRGKFKKDIPNKDLWLEFCALLTPNVKLKWVKGHSAENVWNDYVDKLGQTVFTKKFTIINQ